MHLSKNAYFNPFISQLKVKELVESNDQFSLEQIKADQQLYPRSPSNLTWKGFQVNKIAIIVPYKNRLYNLKLFLRYMSRFLAKKTDILHDIFLVEPRYDNQTFNRGLLLNIGFVESIRYYAESGENVPDCFVFHDVDMLPESDLNDYKCSPERPRQFAVAINTYGYS